MKRKKGYKVIPQMFDVKPVDETGGVDVERIRRIEKILKLQADQSKDRIARQKSKMEMLEKERRSREKAIAIRNSIKRAIPKNAREYQLGRIVTKQRQVPHLIRSDYRPKRKIVFRDIDHKKDASLESFFGKTRRNASLEKKTYPAYGTGKTASTLTKNERQIAKEGEFGKEIPFVEKVSREFEKASESNLGKIGFQAKESKDGKPFFESSDFAVGVKINISGRSKVSAVQEESQKKRGDVLPRKERIADIPEKIGNPFVADFDPVLFDNYFGVPKGSQPIKEGEQVDAHEAWQHYLKPKNENEEFSSGQVLEETGKKSQHDKHKEAKGKEDFSDFGAPLPTKFETRSKKTVPSVFEKRRKKRKNKDTPGILDHISSNYKSISKRALRKIQGGSFVKFPVLRPALSFAVMAVFVSVFVLSGLFVSKGMVLKEDIMVKGQSAVGYIAQAKTDLENQDFESAGKKLDDAKKEFEEAEKEIVFLGGDALDIFSALPYLSKISSGKNIIEAGKLLTEAGKEMAYVAQMFSQIDNPLGKLGPNSPGQLNQEPSNSANSLTDVMLGANEHISKASELLVKAKDSLDNVNPEDLPVQYRAKFEKIKSAIPIVIGTISGFEQNYQIFLDILGHNGPRKYLFLFQNNQEMRATGGFVGSYGILDINDGHIRNLFIDGIFNPDGQLSERVVPPKPIQKVSAVWTMHDSNWFPSFPTSAEKAAWFYEKTGGPTVDGVIALTPTVMQKMLEITGPIEMPQYETTVDKDNFIEKTQYEVEIDYDKELNKPKQFIADLAPMILDKVFSVRNPQQISKVFKVLAGSLKEKHILIYSNNFNLQKIISEQGWSGEILQTSKDFLMVVNTNINGYKTDGVIDETISHKAEVQPDGSIIDTVKIKRVHNGGDSQFDWWNKVNADYMRVYVPKGSQLISAKGQTREFNQPPIDYDQLGFRRDAQVQKEELSMEVDEETGTRIYEEENKTVFANWAYVSPRETVELEYQYLLPFKLDPGKDSNNSDGYSLLVQKQSGSQGSDFSSEVIFPENLEIIWKYPEGLESGQSELRFSGKLQQDRFFGAVFSEKQ